MRVRGAPIGVRACRCFSALRYAWGRRSQSSDRSIDRQSHMPIPDKRLPRRELTQSWIGRPWVLRGSHRWEKDSDRQVRVLGFFLQVRSCWRRHGPTGAQANSPLESAESESAMGWLVRCLRGPTTSRNTPAPSRCAGPEPSARLYVGFLRIIPLRNGSSSLAA